jgi:hypothetical protein
MKDDGQKKFTPQLEIDSEFVHSAFASPCTMKRKCTIGAVCALLRNWQLANTVRDGAVTLKGSHRMGDRRDGEDGLPSNVTFKGCMSHINPHTHRFVVNIIQIIIITKPEACIYLCSAIFLGISYFI